MSRASSSACARGWLAFGIALALHAALCATLALCPGRATHFDAGAGPPVVHQLVIEEEEEVSTFLVPRGRGEGGAPSPGPADPAPREIGVTNKGEDIIPVTHQAAPALPTPGQIESPGDGSGSSGDASGNGRTSGAGGAGAIFQVGRPARSVVYVIDRSSSMGGGLLAAAVRELRASLAQLPPTTQFQVVVYHDQAAPLVPVRGLLPATAENVAHAADALTNLNPEGGTNHLRALQLALTFGAEVIYLLTDADDLRDEDRREVTRLNRGRSIIHTIELNTANRDRADMPLQVLARENGGRYQAVPLGGPR
jgi:hypothetical protein